MQIQVANKQCIRQIAFCNMRSQKTRNAIAIIAIALTTILFTTLFTIGMTIIKGSEQSSFRTIGSYTHGSIKSLSREQFEELKQDPLIHEWGLRRFLAMPTQDPLHKSHVEISYCDPNVAHWRFLDPIEGRLPKEGTNEAATDTAILALLGVSPTIGEKFTLSFMIDGTETTQEFTLCGYWEYDNIAPANHILIPESLVDEILSRLQTKCLDGITGTYNLDIMFANANHIERNITDILERHGYQSSDPLQEDTYLKSGVNWGYTQAKMEQAIASLELDTIAAIVFILGLIIFTGYLIIYNIFQISVSNDIRFLGLLKTIGATGRQLKRMVIIQALFLSAIGIPIGSLIGYGIGACLAPVVLSTLSVYQGALSLNPWIFIGSALFTLATVFLSCRKPGKMAAKVSPIEAVRYTEGADILSRKKQRKHIGGASVYQMAWANLGRNKRKTLLTVISLSLSAVLLNITVSCAQSFDLEKYLYGLKGMSADFLLADAQYFQNHRNSFLEDMSVPEDVIANIESQEGVTGGGRVYGKYSIVEEFIHEDAFRSLYQSFYSENMIREKIATAEKKDDKIANVIQLYGMEPFCLEKMKLIEGDITKLSDSHYIAAVCDSDDYGNPAGGSYWAGIGDTVSLRYIDEVELYHVETGEVYPDVESIPASERENVDVRILRFRDIQYEVAALVEVPSALTYRYYGTNYNYILGAETFIQDTQTHACMYYAFDTRDDSVGQMEDFLSRYTENRMTQYDYESKQTYARDFASFTHMYLLCASALSLIVGFVGILNFLNSFLTSIMARHREFAVLQSVGMTGRQLNMMLVTEGLFLTLSAVTLAAFLTVASAPLISATLGNMLSFLTYRPTLLPLAVTAPLFLLLGSMAPFIIYRLTSGKSIVERLREAE